MEFLSVAARPDHAAFLKREAGYDPGFEKPGDDYIASGEIIRITEEQADRLYDAGKDIYRMCLAAVDHVIRTDRFKDFGIGEAQARLITQSWNRKLPDGTTRDPELACRLDLNWDGAGNIKLFEANADTPTTTYECSTVQWVMVEDLIARGELPEGTIQFNSLEETLTERFSHIFNMASKGGVSDRLHFACAIDAREDLAVTSYYSELAKKAGWKTKLTDIAHIGANDLPRSPDHGKLFDQDNEQIKALFKLVPWEHIAEGDYMKHVARDNVLMMSPPWSAILSNKMLSVVLWEMFPDSPYLLPSYTTPEKLGSTYVVKPIFGREGSGIKVIFDEKADMRGKTPDNMDHLNYAQYPAVYQAYSKKHSPQGGPPFGIVTGLWIVGEEPCGMDMRYDRDSIVTDRDKIRFLPHCMTPHPAI